MASGLMHTTATLCLTAAAVPYYGLDKPHLAVASLLAGLWAVVVQPDLDQIDNGGYYGLYVWDKTAPLVSRLWKFYWMGYAVTLKHRSIWSHIPLLGTAGRLLYGGWWFLPLLANEAGAIFLALVIGADTLHWVMDWKLWGLFGVFTQ